MSVVVSPSIELSASGPRRTWQPDLEQARQDQSRLAVLSRYSAINIVGEFDAASVERVKASLSRCDSDPFAVYHPEFFAWHFALEESVKAGDIRIFQQTLEELPTVLNEIHISRQRAIGNRERIGVAVDLNGFAEDRSGTMPRVRETVKEVVEIQDLVRLSTPTDEHWELMLRIFQFIGEVWPAALAEFTEFIQCIYLFESYPNRVIGFSDWHRHGSVFLRVAGMEDTVWYAEQLLHEAAHVRLNAMLASTPLFLNDDRERYISPLRPDPRPMFGVFHQMFVLARMSHFYARVARLTDRYYERQEATDRHLAEAVELVRSKAILTPKGRELVETISHLL